MCGVVYLRGTQGTGSVKERNTGNLMYRESHDAYAWMSSLWNFQSLPPGTLSIYRSCICKCLVDLAFVGVLEGVTELEMN